MLNDLGLIGFREPFQRLFHQGWVQAGRLEDVEVEGRRLEPDELIDAVRRGPDPHLHPVPGPADQDMDWTPEGVEGMVRFVKRLWRVVRRGRRQPRRRDGIDTPLARKAHETIARVTDDIGRRFVFNTPISAVMELVNELSKAPDDPAARFAAETAVSLLQPNAPHVAEELWAVLGHERLWETPWPVADERLLQRDTVELVLQVNGKVRDRIQVPVGLSEAELVERAKASPKVQAHLNGEERRRPSSCPTSSSTSSSERGTPAELACARRLWAHRHASARTRLPRVTPSPARFQRCPRFPSPSPSVESWRSLWSRSSRRRRVRQQHSGGAGGGRAPRSPRSGRAAGGPCGAVARAGSAIVVDVVGAVERPGLYHLPVARVSPMPSRRPVG